MNNFLKDQNSQRHAVVKMNFGKLIIVFKNENGILLLVGMERDAGSAE